MQSQALNVPNIPVIPGVTSGVGFFYDLSQIQTLNNQDLLPDGSLLAVFLHNRSRNSLTINVNRTTLSSVTG